MSDAMLLAYAYSFTALHIAGYIHCTVSIKLTFMVLNIKDYVCYPFPDVFQV